MIEERHKWLLRDEGVAFEGVDTPRGSGLFGCKLCATQGKTTRVRVHEQASHLAAHRREKLGKREKHDDFLEVMEA